MLKLFFWLEEPLKQGSCSGNCLLVVPVGLQPFREIGEIVLFFIRKCGAWRSELGTRKMECISYGSVTGAELL